MRNVNAHPTLTRLWHNEIESQLLATRDELDLVAGIDTIRYDCVLSCDSMEFEFDSGRDLWLMPQRFTVLQRAYLEPDNLTAFLDRCTDVAQEDKRGVITQLFARQHANAPKKYRWGNCMLGWDFRGGGRNLVPTLTMHSRVSYIAYIGGLDLALCYVLADEIGKRIDRMPEEFAFNWFLSSCQFHFFKSLPALYSLGYEKILLDTERYPSYKFPTLAGVRKWHSMAMEKHRTGVPLSAEKYGPLRRIRRRYEEYKDGVEYSTPLESLTFDPLYRR